MKYLYLSYRFFVVVGLLAMVMAFSFLLPWLFYVGIVLMVLIFAVLVYEFVILKAISISVGVTREVGEVLSLGDEQQIDYTIFNDSKHDVEIVLFDDLPYQLQERRPIGQFELKGSSTINNIYYFRPTSRGEYRFGMMRLLVSLPLTGFLNYMKHTGVEKDTKVFPSILQMKNFALKMTSLTASMYGIRKVRTIGENDEFEHIRQFQQGDNIKSINWKATSRKGELLVNQYQDSRSQMVYCVIDKGRSMEMPFNGLSLLDYSINSSLIISNIVLSKYDKMGLVTFSKSVSTFIPAETHTKQLKKILTVLYNQETKFEESSFEKLYFNFRHRMSRRSIVFLFTNFESQHDLDRNIKYLKAMSKRHLLIVICFKNVQLDNVNIEGAKTITDIYDHTIAQAMQFEKKEIIKDLRRNGIQTIYTRPEDLSVNVINKYLEIKAKRMK